MTYFPKGHACSSVTNMGLKTEFLQGYPAARTVQEVLTAPGFKPMSTGKEKKQHSSHCCGQTAAFCNQYMVARMSTTDQSVCEGGKGPWSAVRSPHWKQEMRCTEGDILKQAQPYHLPYYRQST